MTGVLSTRVGFTGGSTPNPTYRTIGDHTETVEVTYDPEQVTYQQLLDVFWKTHSPTTNSRPQYMSAIFCHGKSQMKLAEANKAELQKHSARKICTVIKPAKEFFTAEDYHQKYMLRQHPQLLQSLHLTPEQLITSYAAAKLNAFVGGRGTLEHFEQVRHELALSGDQATYVRRRLESKQ